MVKARPTKWSYDLVEALALPLLPWQAAPKHRFVRIEPEEVAGRSFPVVDVATWDDPARMSW